MAIAKTLAHENAVLTEGGQDALYALKFVAVDDDLYFLHKCSLFRSHKLVSRKAVEPSEDILGAERRQKSIQSRGLRFNQKDAGSAPPNSWCLPCTPAYIPEQGWNPDDFPSKPSSGYGAAK